jgi:hypothetical protein
MKRIIALAMDALAINTNSLGNKRKINKWDNIPIKSCCTANKIINKMKK